MCVCCRDTKTHKITNSNKSFSLLLFPLSAPSRPVAVAILWFMPLQHILSCFYISPRRTGAILVSIFGFDRPLLSLYYLLESFVSVAILEIDRKYSRVGVRQPPEFEFLRPLSPFFISHFHLLAFDFFFRCSSSLSLSLALARTHIFR